MFDLKGPQFHEGMTSLARYTWYLFNLQHNTTRTVMQQCMRPTAYEEDTAATSCELKRLRHENVVLTVVHAQL
jgi:hypothetical protein